MDSVKLTINGKEIVVKEKVKVGKPELVNLLDRYTDAESLRSATPGELADAMLARVVAHSIHQFLRSEDGNRIIRELKEVGVRFTAPRASKAAAPPNADAGAFGGKTFVITGGFEAFTRDQLREKVKALGGKVTDSVSKNTDVLLCGTDAGSKLDKARALGVAVWEEPELLKKLGQ